MSAVFSLNTFKSIRYYTTTSICNDKRIFMFSDALLLLFLAQNTATAAAAVSCTTKNRYIVVLSVRYKTGLLNFCLSKSVLCKPSIFPYYTTIEVSLSESPKHFFLTKLDFSFFCKLFWNSESNNG